VPKIKELDEVGYNDFDGDTDKINMEIISSEQNRSYCFYH